jgi:glycosyltransferase involved in cell wall biosynthesis
MENPAAQADVINVFYMDIIVKTKYSGVMRVIDSFFSNFADNPRINLHLIRIAQHAPALIFQQVAANQFVIETDNRLNIWEECEFIWKNIAPMFAGKKNIILDVNTINLIDLALFIKQKTGAKIVSRLHCIPWHFRIMESDPKKFYEMMNKPIGSDHIDFYERKNYLMADKMIAVAKTGADLIRNASGIKPAIVHNGVPDKMTVPREFADKAELTAIAVGGFNKAKGIRDSINAVAKANAQGAKIKIIMVGYSSESWRKETCELFPGTDIEFAGTVPFGRLCEMYAAADIGIISSRSEQCNMSGLEMMMMGLPIIVSDIPSVREIYSEDSALFAPANLTEDGWRLDTDKMAEMLRRLAGDVNLRKSLSERARARYLEMFTEKKMIENTVDVYKKLLSIV